MLNFIVKIAKASCHEDGGADCGTSNPAFDVADINSIESGIRGFRFGVGSTVADIFSGRGGGFGLLTLIFFLAGFALLIYLVLGGFQLMTSAGNPDSAAGGKAKITNALIGFVIIFSAYWIVQITGAVLGLDGITSGFGG